MNAAQLLDRVFDVYKRTFWKQLAYAAIVGVAAVMASGFLLVFLSMFIVAATAMVYTGVAFSLILLLAGIVAFMLLWQAASAAGAILLSREAFMGRYIHLPMQNLMRTIGRAFTAMLAQFIVAIPYFVLVGGFIIGFIRFARYVNIFTVERVFYVVLIILLVAAVFGFFMFMHLFSLSIAVAVNERVMFFRALKRSVALIQRDYWRLLGIRVIWFLMVFLIPGAAQGILSMLPVVAAALVAGTPLGLPLVILLNIIGSIGNIVITFAMVPLDGILTAVMYFDRKSVKEGFDMEIAIEDLYRAI